MTAGVVAMSVVTVGLAGLGTSLVAGAALPALDRVAARVSPTAATWLWRAVALAPAIVAVAVVTSVFGLVPCHCVAHGAHHPHLCLDHSGAWPAAGVALIAAGFAVRASLVAARAGRHALRSRAVQGHLEVVSATREDGVRRVPAPDLWAVTIGLWRPRVFITDAMSGDSDARVVVEHERAHARGRHALWQWCAAIAAALHAPGVGSASARRMSIAHEMAADEAAARAVGDRTRVAAALVRLARRASAAPSAGVAFASGSLEVRVRSLLAGTPADGTGRKLAGWMAAVALLGACAIAMNAHRVHHSLETLFGYLG